MIELLFACITGQGVTPLCASFIYVPPLLNAAASLKHSNILPIGCRLCTCNCSRAFLCYSRSGLRSSCGVQVGGGVR